MITEINCHRINLKKKQYFVRTTWVHLVDFFLSFYLLNPSFIDGVTSFNFNKDWVTSFNFNKNVKFDR